MDRQELIQMVEKMVCDNCGELSLKVKRESIAEKQKADLARCGKCGYVQGELLRVSK